jgi:hypothetical protein
MVERVEVKVSAQQNGEVSSGFLLVNGTLRDTIHWEERKPWEADNHLFERRGWSLDCVKEMGNIFALLVATEEGLTQMEILYYGLLLNQVAGSSNVFRRIGYFKEYDDQGAHDLIFGGEKLHEVRTITMV